MRSLWVSSFSERWPALNRSLVAKSVVSNSAFQNLRRLGRFLCEFSEAQTQKSGHSGLFGAHAFDLLSQVIACLFRQCGEQCAIEEALEDLGLDVA